ncbi:right-handed parallel beta-helix repeat-containing protein (plasmid) [Halorussus limi]|uniref:Right-handed parallel beta-helix repeat-containing protein n=1 Tax=Halorussus limi TaxID=2938695 RepID=A0A8U0I0Q1_9EURY|nr:right-handed parallel beta-helix repeat-containing protein [Halorussus limi]UPV76850.1 right-handed parallel beta-helix repeat-containing protein [Halorussus limi]
MSPEDDTPKQSSRRRFLATAVATATAATATSSAVTGSKATAPGELSSRGAALSSEYDTVVDVTEAGADDTGNEPINSVLNRLCNDGATDTLLRFPPGTYAMDEMFRLVAYDRVGFVGDDATVVPTADFDDSAPWLFRLGVLADPGRDLLFEGFTFDFTAPDTGMRALEAQVTDGLAVRDVNVVGFHDGGTLGPAMFDVLDPDGWGTVERFRAPDGGAYSANTDGNIAVGPTGVLVSPYHRGTLRLRDLEVGGFPDNGLYADTPDGRVLVEGGRYRNSNVASVRVAGDGSRVRGTRIEVTHNRPEDVNQRGLRLDAGADLRVENVGIELTRPNGYALSVQDEVESARIEGVNVAVADRPNTAMVVAPTANRVTVADSEIHLGGGGYALAAFGDAPGPVVARNLSVYGWATGGAGRPAVLCHRDHCEFHDLAVYQPGEDRRAIDVRGDDCLVSGGTYMASDTPLYNTGSRTRFEGVTADSWGDSPALYLLDGDGVEVVDCDLSGGVRTGGGTFATRSGNST